MSTTTDTPLRKFLFERSFDHVGRTPEAKGTTYTFDQVSKIKEDALKEGYTAGEQAAQKQQTAVIAGILTQIDRHLQRVVADAVAAHKQQHADTMNIALTIARKLLPDYVARYGLGEIENLIQQALAELSREPRLVIRIAEAQFDAVSGQLNTLTEQVAFAGKVVLLADANLGPADCKIEWADGGIERDSAVIWQEIDRAVAKLKGGVPPAISAVTTGMANTSGVPQNSETTETTQSPSSNLTV